MIQIDGSQGEGGGQILRSSLALSLLTGKEFRLFKIRAGRERPGLQPQHLMSVQAAARISGSRVEGAARGSKELVFRPGAGQSGSYQFDIGTAGATALVLHTIYLPLILRGDAASEAEIRGGTHVTHSPCFHFLEMTWRSYLDRMGVQVGLRMNRPGFYPRGGGIVHATLSPCSRLKPWRDQAADPDSWSVTGFSAVAGLPQDIAKRQARRAAERLRQAGITQVEIHEEVWQGGPGTVVGLSLNTRPVSSFYFGLGERGKRAEQVADEAVEELRDHLDADAGAVDVHSADQLILPLALAEGASEFAVSRVSQHLATNVDVVKKFVEREIQIEGKIGRRGRVQIA